MPEELRQVEISNGLATITVSLEFDGDRESTQLRIDGVKYHFERIKKERLISEYRIDTDPDYEPQSDESGYCYLLAPYSR
jgi:hypothetical protein